MLDPNIQQFLDERKSARLKNKLKPSLSDEEKQIIKALADEEFLLANWLPKASKRANQVALVTHPSKFTHSGAKATPIIASNPAKVDGLLRTGNTGVIDLDVSGNAAALDVYAFLFLKLADDQTILAHLEQGTELIKAQFTVPNYSYDVIKSGLLAIKPSDSDEKKTCGRVKQVYFPVEEGYHLLSLLTPSGLLYKFKSQINAIRFSEATKQAYEAKKKNNFDANGFDTLSDLTMIGFGGANPQGVSLLNSKNGGVSYLLPSVPPVLTHRKIRPPQVNFFQNSLYYKNYEDSFKALDKLMSLNHNNVHIRQGRDNIICFVIHQVIDCSWKIRQLESGWSEKTQLKDYQKIWLDNAYQQQRSEEDEWLKMLISAFAGWFIFAYKKTLVKNKAKHLIDTELSQIKELITEQQEGLL